MGAYGVFGNLLAKARYSVFQRALNSRAKKFTSLLKEYTQEELEDRVIPSHEIVEGKKVIEVGTCQANLNLDGLKVITTWTNDKGKVSKSVPVAIKQTHAAEIKAVKSEAKSIEETLNAQGKRLESLWMKERSWSFEDWKSFYLDHPLMQLLITRLIWQAQDENTSMDFMVANNQFIDQQGNPIEIPAKTKIVLWHPAIASVENVLLWRTLLFDRQIRQPFKQAFREVYLLTEAEENTHDHSNRFLGHHLKGNTLYSLGKNRNWTMTYEEAPLLKIPSLNMTAELMIQGGVLYSNCFTQELVFKQVEFTAKGVNRYKGTKIPLKDVPPIVLSEVMRDVDLFVAVAGIGIDPYFDQNGDSNLLNYWNDVSFGDKSKTPSADIRKDLLNRLLPMIKIAKQCAIEGNYLKVQGKIRNYKINLGSGNILMEPNDQYLCIVPGRNASLEKKIWLPFEGGDRTLILILSKAFLLAADDKITDSSIISQISRK